jgi:REP element-mobilizing transposase RayT
MDDALPRAFDRREVSKRSRRLPHWEIPEGTYFLTFRLAGSLPMAVLATYQEELNSLRQRGSVQCNDESEREKVRLYCRRIDRALDSGVGECYLAEPPIAAMVSSAIEHFNDDRYNLHAYCVMPNHVHAVITLASGVSLAPVLHSLKSFTATKANHYLGRRGRFWQDEYFDHLVRSGKDLERLHQYVMDNPRKAGLEPWKWCRSFRSGTSENARLHGLEAHATEKDG